MKKLYTGYQYFWKFVINLDAFYGSEHSQTLWSQLVHTMSTEYKGVFRNNLLTHMWSLLALVSSINYSSCRELGVKMGAMSRKSLGLELTS